MARCPDQKGSLNGFSIIAQISGTLKWLFFAISVSDADFNPRHTLSMTPVKIFVFLYLAKTILFYDATMGNNLKQHVSADSLI